ncbi:hypothetical protein HanHA89_Chr04g0168931 [Helianthus annuus]|nr:hypothetical protein HanHA89_Chr04g0168931 [Helianthus annuus]
MIVNSKVYLDIHLCLRIQTRFQFTSSIYTHFLCIKHNIVKMLSFWDENYFFNNYSNDAWGVNDTNEEEEVVSDVPVDQKIQMPYLNETPTPPVDKPYYLAHQVYPDYGYGYKSPYMQQGNIDGYIGYGAENAPLDEPYYPTQQSYPGYGYGGEVSYVQQDSSDRYGEYGGYVGYGGYGYEPHNTPLYDDYQPSTPGNPVQIQVYHINICIILIRVNYCFRP